MKKNNKILKLVMSSTLLIGTSSFVLISCNSKNTIRISLPFTNNDPRYKTLEKIVHYYNETIVKKTENMLPVSLNSGTTRDRFYYSLSLQLYGKDYKTPHLALYYPSLVNLINEYNRNLDFSSLISNQSIYKNFLRKSPFDSSGSNFILPLAISGETLIINKSLLGYLLNQLLVKTNKITIAKEPNYFRDSLDFFQNLPNQQKQKIAQSWNLNNLNYDFDNNIVLNNDYFKTYESLFELSSLISKITNNLSSPNPKKIFYNHNIANMFYSQLFNDANANFDNYFLKYYKNSSNLNYQQVFTKSSAEYQSLKKYYDYRMKAIHEKLVFVRPKNPASINFSEQTLFSIASTRIYEMLNNENNKTSLANNFIYTNSPLKNNSKQSNSSFLTQGLYLMGIKHSDTENKQTLKFVEWFYNTNFKDTKLTGAEYFAKQTNYVFPSNNFLNSSKKDLNVANTNLSRLIAQANYDKSLVNFEEPFDSKSDLFRHSIESIIKNIVYSYDQSKTYDFQWFIDKLKELNF
ncbi:P80 family lipoprotein [Metamycoplasma arthritidis]|uniref:Hypothetical lipoprotein n=1 Tax=Metamycoplasma arthritidis (strain 158L3-1) TaxID=243272 RepID=B3PNG2_META1|nr:P80 family lipoprotein [Metamycoplasma arthritidis]ACF07564.1 hypothetical lipoprotein [Metamycoplasma arthritidis 158L3-1]